MRVLAADEQTHLDGVPLTTPARTLLDLSTCVGAAELERALARADREGIADQDTVSRLVARYPGRRGTRRLLALLANPGGPALTRSDAEARFLELVRSGRLREPETNIHLRGHEVDFVWRSERLIVEVDGFAFHSSRTAFEADRRRDAALAAAGFRVIRVTWTQITKEPAALLVRVAQALVESGSTAYDVPAAATRTTQVMRTRQGRRSF
jgi:very-short-patch-repair endonuclease